MLNSKNLYSQQNVNLYKINVFLSIKLVIIHPVGFTLNLQLLMYWETF